MLPGFGEVRFELWVFWASLVLRETHFVVLSSVQDVVERRRDLLVRLWLAVGELLDL